MQTGGPVAFVGMLTYVSMAAAIIKRICHAEVLTPVLSFPII